MIGVDNISNVASLLLILFICLAPSVSEVANVLVPSFNVVKPLLNVLEPSYN